MGYSNRLQGRDIAGMYHREKKQDVKTYVEILSIQAERTFFRVYALFFVCVFAAKQLRRLMQEHERKGCGNTANVVGRHAQQSSINLKTLKVWQSYILTECVLCTT